MGKITYVTCAYCGRTVPRNKAVPITKLPSWLAGIDRRQMDDLIFVGGGREKMYICISCAKHRRISFAPWRRKIVAQDRVELEKRRKKALGRKRSRSTKRRDKQGKTS